MSPTTQGDVISSGEKTLKDILFGLYEEQIAQKANGSQDVTIYKNGYYPFPADSTSILQTIIDTKNLWDKEFFGIFMPDIGTSSIYESDGSIYEGHNFDGKKAGDYLGSFMSASYPVAEGSTIMTNDILEYLLVPHYSTIDGS
jgi:hypothetical protein